MASNDVPMERAKDRITDDSPVEVLEPADDDAESANTKAGGRSMPRAVETLRADPAKPYGDVTYADPGYQADGKKRYPLDTEEHCRAAWSYINQKGNAGKYTAGQLKLIRSRIMAAMRRHGVDMADDGRAAFDEMFGDLRAFFEGDHPRVESGPTGGQFTSAGGAAPAKKSAVAQKRAPRMAAGKPMAKKPADGALAYDPDTGRGPGYGMKGGDPRVRGLQQALTRLGLTDAAGKKLAIDGKLGPKTTAAVKAAQRRIGVPADGRVTPALLGRLVKAKTLPGRSADGGLTELRDMGMCVRDFGWDARAAGDGRTLEGFAAVYNTPARIRDLQGDFDEVILPGAFDRSLRSRKPIMQWDHGKDPRVGTVPIAAIDELDPTHRRGLYVRARLFDNPVVEPIRQAIAEGAVTGMSFRFEVPRHPEPGDTWTRRDNGIDLREIRDADTHEIGPVAFPAYDSTSVSVRSLLAQLDAAERRQLVRELMADLRAAVDLENFTGASSTRSGDRGEPGTAAEGVGAAPVMHLRQRLDDGALRARGILR